MVVGTRGARGPVRNLYIFFLQEKWAAFLRLAMEGNPLEAEAASCLPHPCLVFYDVPGDLICCRQPLITGSNRYILHVVPVPVGIGIVLHLIPLLVGFLRFLFQQQSLVVNLWLLFTLIIFSVCAPLSDVLLWLFLHCTTNMCFCSSFNCCFGHHPDTSTGVRYLGFGIYVIKV